MMARALAIAVLVLANTVLAAPARPVGASTAQTRTQWTYASVRQQIYWAAVEFNVNYWWLLRVAQCESGLNPNATNYYSGAAGLYQFMWPTFWSMLRQSGLWWQYGTWISPYNPRVASRLAAWAFSRGYSGAWVCR